MNRCLVPLVVVLVRLPEVLLLVAVLQVQEDLVLPQLEQLAR